MSLVYKSFEFDQRAELVEMSKSLYREDQEGALMTDEKINATIEFFTSSPKSGEILLFSVDEIVIGYSILIHYWSNEYGGQILFIDELFLKPEYRSKSYGTDFLQFLFKHKKGNFKAILLEVFPSNTSAYRFYKRNGFVENRGTYLKYKL